jgi:hypothetical protein
MVKSNTIMFGWNKPLQGREGIAGELFTQTINFYEKCKTSGKIESYEPVFLSSHGGDLNGFFLIKGTHEQIDNLVCNDEFVDITMRANHCLSHVGVIHGFTGNMVNECMQKWMKTIPSK